MISLVGLLALIILSKFSEPELMSIKDLNKNYANYLDKEVKIQGFAVNFKQFESGDVILNIKDLNDSIQARGSFSSLSIKQNDYCEFIGTLKEYNSEYFIEIKSMKIR